MGDYANVALLGSIHFLYYSQLIKQFFRLEDITISKSVSQSIEFSEEEISLKLPVEGQLSGEWKLESLVYPAVSYSRHDACVCTIIIV